MNNRRFFCGSFSLGFLLALVATAAAAKSDDRVISGAFWSQPPTLVSLGFEWRIKGDDNRNAQVDVSYRKVGEAQWRKGLPLIRSQHEYIGPTGPVTSDRHPDPFDYSVPNLFAGSILDLEPDTAYEASLVLADPDGVAGPARKLVKVRTRKEPMPAAGGHVYHAYPIDWTGPKEPQAFTGLMEAYYQGAASSDYQGTYPPRVQPGDVILMHAGVYKSDRYRYLSADPHKDYLALSTLFDGTYYLTQSGTADRPIVIKAAGDGEVIFDGDGAQTLFNLMAANHTYFENITFRNANLVFLLGLKNIAGASGFTLKHSRLYDIGRGVQDDWSGSKNFYIADNIFIGRHDPKRLLGWTQQKGKESAFAESVGGPEGSEYAVKLYGQGHVVAFNYLANWHDGIDVATYGAIDGGAQEIQDRTPVSIDFYNNDFYNMADNCVEIDGGARNIRVFRNRCFNTTFGALSAAPLLGGPAYVYRNVVYNAGPRGALKYGQAAGVQTFNNTFFADVRSTASSSRFINNLIIGPDSKAPVFSSSSYTAYSSADYNGFRPNPKAAQAFEWNTPRAGAVVDYKNPLERRTFAGLADYARGSGQDSHSRIVDHDAFIRASAPDPADSQRLYSPEEFDLRLAAGSAAIDAGMFLPNVSDGYTGKAPDLGAYEAGQPLPRYGPRFPPPGTPLGDGSIRSIAGPPAPDGQ